MVVIHVQEVTSTQVTEIIAETLEDALFAYAHNACDRWETFAEATAEYYYKSDAIKKMVFIFDDEQLTLYNVYGERFTAEWK